MKRGAAAGTIAGAVGTLALDVVSYGDMLVQGRAASALPGQAAARLAETVGFGLGTADADATRNRATGPAVGKLAMVVANGPMVAQRLTDPRTWGLRGWLSDVVPHLAYGWATVATYRAITAS